MIARRCFSVRLSHEGFALRKESGRPRLLPAGVPPDGEDEGKRECWV
jgi:hypothetical protein